MLTDAIRRSFTQLGVHTAHPLAFLLVALYGLSWFFFERETFNWHAVATMATWFMTLFIQRAEPATRRRSRQSSMSCYMRNLGQAMN